MVIIIVAAFFITAIALDALVVERLAHRKAKEMFLKKFALDAMGEPDRDMLYTEGHTWLRLDRAAFAVGLDEFTRRLAGTIDAIQAPEPGDRVTKGKTAWTLRIGERELAMPSPLTGTVYEVHRDLVSNPAQLGNPFANDAWIIKIAPDHALSELPDLYTPARFRKWFDLQKVRLFAACAPQLGPAMADGDEVQEGAARHMDDDTWNHVCEIVYGQGRDESKSV